MTSHLIFSTSRLISSLCISYPVFAPQGKNPLGELDIPRTISMSTESRCDTYHCLCAELLSVVLRRSPEAIGAAPTDESILLSDILGEAPLGSSTSNPN